jgi:ribonuclease E
MSNKMLIDATHPEETRVVVLRGNRVEEFDFEAADRQQLRGNIYLAKVTRVEPSLQAAFVDYGGNRHGFLAFSEIHPDYYQIPFADRQALLQEQAREDAEQAEHDDRRAQRDIERAQREDEEDRRADEEGGREGSSAGQEPEVSAAGADAPAETSLGEPEEEERGPTDGIAADAAPGPSVSEPAEQEPAPPSEVNEAAAEDSDAVAHESFETAAVDSGAADPDSTREAVEGGRDHSHDHEHVHDEEKIESVGAEDALEELPERRKPRPRQYKIQEVIKRRQVLLVQVVKEERGNKGAALTTYLSLAGRYSVLMPNTARGGGISRKITTPLDRKRLKSIAQELEVPEGMGVILRTAGANRTKSEIKRDFEYLLRLWENVRELTLRSSAPKLVYEEGSLIKRSIRDLYSREIDQVVVAGDDAYREAKDFMRMLMPSHARNVQLYKDSVPVFARNGVEAQLDAMFSPQVTLKSGGYIVINQTEALVSIDVNSGRSTREHSIEDTALNTNLEAAEEISRQLRLRDLAGLIVIDFIDMEEKRNNRSVERKLKDCLRADRARIQVGRISHFGLMEMSRQRIRTGVLESSVVPCPHCRGTGQVRSVSSLSLQILRGLEDHLLRHSGHNLLVRTRPEVALYVLNQKRRHLADLEERFGPAISISGEPPENGAGFTIERGSPVEERPERSGAVAMTEMPAPEPEPVEAVEPEDDEIDAGRDSGRDAGRGSEDALEGRDKRRRRRRRRGNGDDRHERAPVQAANDDVAMDAVEGEPSESRVEVGAEQGGDDAESRESRRRRRGRRGGRRRGRGRENGDFDENRTTANGPQEPADGYARPGEVAGGSAEDFGNAGDITPEPIGDPDIEEVEALTDASRGDHGSNETPIEPEEARPAEPEAPAQPVAAKATLPPPEPPVEDNRPKRSGWWSRKSSFF